MPACCLVALHLLNIGFPGSTRKRVERKAGEVGDAAGALGKERLPWPRSILTRLPVCALQPQDDYSVLFEDTSYADGYSPPLNVAQRYVVACKEPKKK